MDHMRLSDELRQQLLESAAWGKAGININEESAEEQLEEGTKKGKTRKTARKAFVKPEEAAREDAGTEYEGDGEELEEEAIHVCPLCVSQLDEPIEEDALLEHLDVVMGLVERLSNLNEEEEDVEAVIDSALEELLLSPYEEE